MLKKKFVGLIFFPGIILVLFFLTNCNAPGTNKPDDIIPLEDDGDKAIVTLIAAQHNSEIHLNWTLENVNQNDVVNIKVYRNNIKIKNIDGYINLSSDNDFDNLIDGHVYAYYISVTYKTGDIDHTIKSSTQSVKYINKTIENLSIDWFRKTGHIYLSWKSVVSTDINPMYNIYRYTSRYNSTNNIEPVKLGPVTTNEYFDDTALENTLYFYRVSFEGDNAEYVKCKEEKGIYISDVIDVDNFDFDSTDNNDNKANAKNILKKMPETAVIYSIKTGDVYEQDVDWYNYTGMEDNIFINIDLPAGSPLIGQLMLEVAGEEKKFNTAIQLTGSITFCISFKFADPDDAIGSYTLHID